MILKTDASFEDGFVIKRIGHRSCHERASHNQLPRCRRTLRLRVQQENEWRIQIVAIRRQGFSGQSSQRYCDGNLPAIVLQQLTIGHCSERARDCRTFSQFGPVQKREEPERP
jgi:hypothetical protein